MELFHDDGKGLASYLLDDLMKMIVLGVVYRWGGDDGDGVAATGCRS